MIYGLTKDDFARLSDEQQQTIARVALDQARYRRELRQAAKGYSGYRLVPILLLTAATALWMFRPDFAKLIPFLLIGLAGLVQFHANGINNRIDAVLKLMDLPPEEQGRKQGMPLPGSAGPSEDELREEE